MNIKNLLERASLLPSDLFLSSPSCTSGEDRGRGCRWPGQRERGGLPGSEGAASGGLFFFGRVGPVGGPIVMQRCINNATGLLNAPLPWGPLCLSEHGVCVCFKAPEEGARHTDLQPAQVTLVVFLSQVPAQDR